MNWTYKLAGAIRVWSCLAGRYMANVTEAGGRVSWWIQDGDGRQYAAGTAESPDQGKEAAQAAFMRLPGAEGALAEMVKVARAQQDNLAIQPREQPLCPHCRAEIDASEAKAGEISEQRCDVCGEWLQLTPHVLYTTSPIKKA